MTLQQLRYVITVAQKGSISEAAKELFISQPSLSNAIKELEKEMKIIIFSRTNKGIIISDEGLEFLGYARQVLEQAELLENRYLETKSTKKRFNISTQHYSFAVNAFVDLVKKSVINEFTGTISIDKIVLSLITAFIIGVFIIYIYKKTYNGVVYSKSFSLCVILLAMVTALIIRTINSNLALSLGMVGALSIVRFRTAVKEPVDTGFMFWGITAGIMAGAGLYLIAIISSVALGLLYYVSYILGFKANSQYLMILRYDSRIDAKIEKMIEKIPKHKIKSKSITKDKVELSFEISDKNYLKLMDIFKEVEGIDSVNLISYQNDFGA